MFKPDSYSDRLDYAELLYPPQGYILSMAIGTTYSLNLESMLTIPISLVLSSSFSVGENKDKIHILDALIRSMEKIKVYCQKGKIKVPDKKYNLFPLLEESIVQVLPFDNSSFHPKVWVIRYESENDKPIYKVIVLSRNLTLDRSYDISLAVDGKVSNNVRKENSSICDFVNYLREKEDFKDSSRFLEELNMVDFNVEGSPFNSIEFLPMGIEKKQYDLLNSECNNLLIISPFLSDDILKDISKTSSLKPKLISRKYDLSKVDPLVLDNFECFHLKDEIVDGEKILEIDEDNRSQDIHSKIYVREQDSETEIYLGSANCSHRAFNSNIEFMIKLTTDKRNYNIKKMLKELMGEDDNKCIFTKLDRESMSDKESEEQDEIKELMNQVERYICSLSITGEVIKSSIYDLYDIFLNITDEISMLEEIEVTLRPLTLRNNNEKLNNHITFSDINERDVTKFFIIYVEYKGEVYSFLIKIDLKNMPEQRNGAIVKMILSNKTAFLNYISFILGDSSILEIARILEEEGSSRGSEGKNSFIKKAMFEKLLKASSRDEGKIREVKYVMDILGNNEIIPDDFKILFSLFESYIKGEAKE
ncbi:MAG: hypothetical protein K0R54_3583 [Clostridiaceae bacterium]|jgi:HKD family nuclease|nr:hypothetical protein [Clostridiaceae bacterium]